MRFRDLTEVGKSNQQNGNVLHFNDKKVQKGREQQNRMGHVQSIQGGDGQVRVLRRDLQHVEALRRPRQACPLRGDDEEVDRVQRVRRLLPVQVLDDHAQGEDSLERRTERCVRCAMARN